MLKKIPNKNHCRFLSRTEHGSQPLLINQQSESVLSFSHFLSTRYMPEATKGGIPMSHQDMLKIQL